MKHLLSTLLKRFETPVQPPLGRWRLDYCSKKIDYKVNLTNEDHCGTCNSYRLTKVDVPPVKIPASAVSNTDTQDIEDYLYLCI